MQISNLPVTKLPIPFAASAGGGYIRTIPQASQIGIVNGAASLTDGFPPLNFVPVGSGGVPPYGQDMNGILFEISSWTSWQNAGGLVPYDSAFSAAIGGYPINALLAGTAAGSIFLSLADNNTANPNTVGANWVQIASATSVVNSSYSSAVASGTATALTITLTPAPIAYTKFMSIEVQTISAATGAATINVNGLGAKAIVGKTGAVVIPGLWQSGDIMALIYDGTSFRVVGGNTTITSGYSTTYSTPAGVSNSVLTQAALTAGSTSFGAISANQFVFSRAGTYAVSMAATVSLAVSGAAQTAATCQIRQNGGGVTGAASGDSDYLPGATTTSFTQYGTGVINAAVNDTVTIFASVGSNANFSSGSINSTVLSIIPLS